VTEGARLAPQATGYRLQASGLTALFVCGTDTGVGKTEVGRALLALWAARGLTPRALKPVETGCPKDAPEDALALRAACGPPHDALPLDAVCPQRFLLPAAPLVAAEAEGGAVDLARIDALVREALVCAARPAGALLVEAAGGLLVPLAREQGRLFTNLDLARLLGLPVLLVARAGLGTINHCALSAQALRLAGVPVVAIVLNRTSPVDDPALASNARVVAELTGLPILGPTPFVPEPSRRPQALAPALAPLLDGG
jgi:dethiobiotin synthetase